MKHLLLLNYCQSLVCYLLRKAKGLSIEGHPVVRSLVEIRLFLETCHYHLDLCRFAPLIRNYSIKFKSSQEIVTVSEKSVISEKGTDTQKEDLLKYRPNLDMLKPTATAEDGANVYRPPKFAPTLMDKDKMSKQERNEARREKERWRSANQSPYRVELLNDLEGRPEEVRESVGT
ncbi:hypothetical protein CQW23_17777 [Capsicum baccatum]|uniref:Uncharacterized protein n=1 Tax=Capsicum baccatum TaxID=33114 RepID=A0A2G2WEV1_CAPBA|nr:hypothetical protein CQW23_17777 [Capsicum baccatum]